MQRCITSINMVHCQQGVIELDPTIDIRDAPSTEVFEEKTAVGAIIHYALLEIDQLDEGVGASISTFANHTRLEQDVTIISQWC